MTNRRCPRILLIGSGRFGLLHLEEWRRIEALGEAELVAVVSRRGESIELSHQERPVRVVDALSDQILDQVDAVDIVTPAATHAELIRRCLPRAHVLVEKPMTTDLAEAEAVTALARRHGRALMVGHLFRFHPVVRELKRMVEGLAERPRSIEGQMVNPLSEKPAAAEPSLELLHLFDIVDFLFGVEPEVTMGRWRGDLQRSSLRYAGPMTAVFDLGWTGARKLRTLQLHYRDRRILADLIDNTVVVSRQDQQLERRVFPGRPTALFDQLRSFAAALSGGKPVEADGTVGARIVGVAVAARAARRPGRPRVAVIGGGIFGATCAIELAAFGEVTLFESNQELLSETSGRNQGRHHTGFHYPRSYETMVEIAAARADFETDYGAAIDRSVPAYYCTSATGVEIPASRYLAACQSARLAWSVEEPPAGVLDSSRVSLCLKTDEAVYDFQRLIEMVAKRLRERRVCCRLGTAVVGTSLESNGDKLLASVGGTGPERQAFDYVINATYGRRNSFAHWLGFPIAPLRFDLVELLALRLPIPRVSITVLDGPFTSLIGVGLGGRFLLSHIHDSVAQSVVPEDGFPPRWPEQVGNRDNMLRHARQYLPILEQAEQVESCWMTRAVLASARDFDARPTVVTDHGFGCWSLLGGKIVTCVSNARRIARTIAAECA